MPSTYQLYKQQLGQNNPMYLMHRSLEELKCTKKGFLLSILVLGPSSAPPYILGFCKFTSGNVQIFAI